MYSCGATRCLCCGYLGNSHIIKSCSNGFSSTITQLVNCNTRFVIYLVTCISCNIQYVGRTTRRLGDRMRDHFSHIRTNKNTNLARHFNQFHHQSVQAYKLLKFRPLKGWIVPSSRAGRRCTEFLSWTPISPRVYILSGILLINLNSLLNLVRVLPLSACFYLEYYLLALSNLVYYMITFFIIW